MNKSGKIRKKLECYEKFGRDHTGNFLVLEITALTNAMWILNVKRFQKARAEYSIIGSFGMSSGAAL